MDSRLSRGFLQAKYVGRLLWELPGHYHRWVIRGRAPWGRKMFRERLGIVPAPARRPGRRMLIDTNGHGEYNQVHTFLRLFRSRYPDWAVTLISWNPEIVELASGHPLVDQVVFAPWDVGWIARRALRRLAPGLFVSVDQVRLPFLVRAAKEVGARTILISASFPEVYIDSVHLRKALAFEFPRFFDRICVADAEARRSFLRIGCDEARLRTTGYMKFDVEHLATTEDERRALRQQLGLGDAGPVWLAGSVRRGEERLVLEAYARLRTLVPDLRLILAPRYVTDAEEAGRAATEQGLKWVRRTEIQGAVPDDRVIVIDTYGELAKLYAIADVAFVGNSLSAADRYALGQNLAEPLVHRKPVLFGPHMNKWKALTAELKEAWPGLEVTSAAELVASLAHLLRSRETAARVERKIDEILARNGRAVADNFAAVVELLERG